MDPFFGTPALAIWVPGPEHSTIHLMSLSHDIQSPRPGLTLPVGSITTERHTYLTVFMCEIQHVLWKIRCLNNAADLDRSFFLDQFADRIEEFGGELDDRLAGPCPNPCELHSTYFRIPPVLPRDEPDQARQGIPCVSPLLIHPQYSPHGLGGESNVETLLICLESLVVVV